MTCDKPFLTYEQQIKMLREDKKLQIKDEEYATALLKKYSYFALISGYKAPFKAKNGKYKLHTSIEDIYALYCFDDKMRALFLQYILKVEKQIKSLISYSFCKKYGAEQEHYLNATNYNYNIKTQNQINELISRLNDILTHDKDYKYIKHQKLKHQNVPLWVMTKALTLGSISKMYSVLPQTLQAEISKEFLYVHEGMLTQMLDLLARVRNVCAHNERLYNYNYLKGTIDDTDVHAILELPEKDGRYKKGKNDLFAVVIVLKYLLEEEDFVSFLDELEVLLNDLLKKTRSLSKEQMHKYMGFPENWRDIKTCAKTRKKAVCVATRESYGKALTELGKEYNQLVVLDADLAEATKTVMFKKEFPERHINCGIAENNMTAIAAGLAACGKIPFISSFAMFVAGRSYEQIRNSIGYPHLNVKIGATHAGISVGEDGATHQCLEDISLMREIPGMVVINPSDDIEAKAAVRAAVEHVGPVYIRFGRLPVPVFNDESNYKFELGKGIVLKEGTDVSIFATGIEVYEALQAAELLEQDGIHAEVINIHTIKPLDEELVIASALKTGKVVTVEEHSIIGGLGTAICEVLSEKAPTPVLRLGVEDCFGVSGPAVELIQKYGLDGVGIYDKVKKFM